MTAILLRSVSGKTATCRYCQAPFQWATTIEGKPISLEVGARITPNGENELVVDSFETHWAHCKQAQQAKDDAELKRLRFENRDLKQTIRAKDGEIARLNELLQKRQGD